MLELQRACVQYAGSDGVSEGLVCGLAGIGFAVHPGERVGVLGPNGSGKSTLLRCLCGYLELDGGSLFLDGHVVETDDAYDVLRQTVGLVGQDPDDQMVASTVFDEVAFGPCNLGLSAEEVHGRVDAALAACDLAGFEQRDVATLSGGQRQRVALAGVLAMEPRYLLLDEPCSMLDAPARLDVLAAVERAAAAGCGVVHVTHELSEVLAYDRIVVLEGGRLLWEGTPDALLGRPDVLERSACLRERVEPVAPWSFDSSLSARPALLEIEHATLCYDEDADVVEYAVHDVSLRVRSGEVVLVAGHTGSGKSTLARIASGLLEPDAGTCVVEGRSVRPGMVGYAFQRTEEQLFADTVLDDVMFGPRNQGLDASVARRRALDALELVGLEAERYGARNPFALSGGQMRRAALAGVLAMETAVVVLDEPTVGLDAHGVRNLMRVVARLREQGRGVVLITHDVERLLPVADTVVRLEGGRVAWTGAAVPERGVDCDA